MPKKLKKQSKKRKDVIDINNSVLINLIIFMIIITSIVLFNFYIYFITFSYLYDLKENVDCYKINSKVINFYYNYFIFIILLPFILSILHQILLYLNIYNETNFNLLRTLISLACGFTNIYFVKILYDLRYEEECKDIEPKYREILFYLNLFCSILWLINIVLICFMPSNVSDLI